MTQDNPHPIGSLAYWEHSLADYDHRLRMALASGFKIKARRFRDDIVDIKTIIERVKAENSSRRSKDHGSPVVTIPADAPPVVVTVPRDASPLPAKPRNGKKFAKCIDCGKPHQGAQQRCRDCKTEYRHSGDYAERQREKHRAWYAERQLRKLKKMQ